MDMAVKARKIVYPLELPARALRPNLSMLEHICNQMREDEIDQYLAITGAEKYDPMVAAAAMGQMCSRGPALCYLTPKGVPVCAGGYVMDPNIGGVWQSWMCGTTEGWKTHWRSITKTTKWVMRELMDGGARRLETTVLANRTQAIEWYTESLGLRYEGTRHEYTEDGRDLLLFGLTRSQWFENDEDVDHGRR